MYCTYGQCQSDDAATHLVTIRSDRSGEYLLVCCDQCAKKLLDSVDGYEYWSRVPREDFFDLEKLKSMNPASREEWLEAIKSCISYKEPWVHVICTKK